MDFIEMCFYAEQEGVLPTRKGKINAVIHDLKKYPEDEIPFEIFIKILEKHDLKDSSLSTREIDYINKMI